MFERSGSTLVTFQLPQTLDLSKLHFKIIGSHTDSPVLKLRPITIYGPSFNCNQIQVATYGGGLWNTWFDRDLTLSGRLYYKDEDSIIKTKLVHVDRPIILLPNFCIHLRNSDERDFIKFNKERHLRPIIALNNIDNKK